MEVRWNQWVSTKLRNLSSNLRSIVSIWCRRDTKRTDPSLMEGDWQNLRKWWIRGIEVCAWACVCVYTLGGNPAAEHGSTNPERGFGTAPKSSSPLFAIKGRNWKEIISPLCAWGYGISGTMERTRSVSTKQSPHYRIYLYVVCHSLLWVCVGLDQIKYPASKSSFGIWKYWLGRDFSVMNIMQNNEQ